MRKVIIMLCCMLSAYACTPEQTSTPIAKHIVYIGLDGWGSYCMDKAQMPTVKRLMEQGCWTLQKRTVLPSSSAVNWASMFMGAGPELHGYTEWGSQTPELPSRVLLKNNIFPTIFQLYRDADPNAEIGVLSEWAGIKYLVDTLSCSYVKSGIDYEKYPDALCEATEAYIMDKHPNLVAVCFDQPDHVGHAIGHDTPEYYLEMERLDKSIARIVAAVDKAGMTDETIFIITSDHGGIGKGHGGKTMNEMETPFIIAGKGVKKGGEFAESMVQYDVASTMAYILRLQQPQVWTGRPLKQLFE